MAEVTEGEHEHSRFQSAREVRAKRTARNKQVAESAPAAPPTPAPQAAPTVTSVNPTSVPWDYEPFDIQVIGTGFVDGDEVVLNGNDLITTFVSATELLGYIPSGITPGNWTVQVENAAGERSESIPVVAEGPMGGAAGGADVWLMEAGPH